jgi:acetyl esterase/lipase
MAVAITSVTNPRRKIHSTLLDKGMNVVNLNYRLKRGIPVATEDSTNALHFLKANNANYQLNLNRVILTGFRQVHILQAM